MASNFCRIGRGRCLLIVHLTFLLGAALARADTPKTLVRVGAYNDSYPLSYVDTDGKLKGFAVDLLDAVADKMGMKVERLVGNHEEVAAAVHRGGVDMYQSFSESVEHRKEADFTVPYLQMSGAIVVRKGTTNIHSLADLNGKTVFLGHENVGGEVLAQAGVKYTSSFVDAADERLRRLARGEGDAALLARLTAASLIAAGAIKGVEIVGAPVPGYSVRLCFAVCPTNKALLAELNEGLAILQRKNAGEISEYDRIYNRWFGRIEGNVYSRVQIASAIAAALAVALGIASWAIVRQRSLNRRITEQANALHASESNYRSVFESAADGLIVARLRPGPPAELMVDQANPSAIRTLALPDGKWTGQSLTASAPFARPLVDEIAQQRPTFETALEISGQRRWLRVTQTGLGPNLLLAITDITEARLNDERLKKSEQQLRQTQKLEAIGTLASGVAHDFNNILAAIMVNAELTEMDLEAGHPARGPNAEILSAAQRAKVLVNQILTFARKAESNLEEVAPSAIVSEALRFLRATTPTSIEIRHQEKADLPRIKVDPTQLHQVIMNLCTNAVHALNGLRGSIEVTEDLVEIDSDLLQSQPQLRPGTFVCITVHDTGCGMPPEVLQHVFEPFYTTKGPGVGTGLGLSVVHGIVQSHGGGVSVYSRPGKGTTFRVYLPVTAPGSGAAEAKPGPSPAQGRGRGQRILVIDDEKAISAGLAMMLEKMGYEPTVHNRSLEAMADFARKPMSFDLVFTDLTMPDLGGLDLAERIRTLNPAIPILVASGYFDDADRSRAREIAGTTVVEKPLNFAAVSRLLGELLGGAN